MKGSELAMFRTEYGPNQPTPYTFIWQRSGVDCFYSLQILCDKSMLTVENKPVDQMTSQGDVTSTQPRIELNFMTRYKDAYRNELEHFLDVIEGKSTLFLIDSIIGDI